MRAQDVSIFILGPSESEARGRERCRCGNLVSCEVQSDIEFALALDSGNDATCHIVGSCQVEWRRPTRCMTLGLCGFSRDALQPVACEMAAGNNRLGAVRSGLLLRFFF